VKLAALGGSVLGQHTADWLWLLCAVIGQIHVSRW